MRIQTAIFNKAILLNWLPKKNKHISIQKHKLRQLSNKSSLQKSLEEILYTASEEKKFQSQEHRKEHI